MDGLNNPTAKVADAPIDRWPAWAKVASTLALVLHATAVWSGAWGKDPASDFERSMDSAFEKYHEVTRLGQSYRYYSPEPPPTPVVTATLSFVDGRPEKVVRLPERGTRPRLLYQRQLALAHALMEDFQMARQGHGEGEAGGDGSTSPYAHAFATHLCRTNPRAKDVTLRLQLHLVPDIRRVRELREKAGSNPVDLDADEFYTAPERIGVYPCDAS